VKAAEPRHGPRPTLRVVANTLAVLALTAFAATRFAYANIIWDPGYYGEYGLTVNPWANFTVRNIVPGSPADKAGIRVGDRIERPKALHERLTLFRIVPRPAERITLTVIRGDQRRAVSLQARPLPPRPAPDRALLALHFAWLFAFVAVTLVLVLLRPSMMTWGLFLFPLNLAIIFSQSDLYFSYIPTNAFLTVRFLEDIIAPAGIIGFLIFGICFPANETTGWRETLESLAPFLFLTIAGSLIYWDLANILIRPTMVIPYALEASAVVVFAAGTVVLATRYGRANDLERRSIAWVIVGLLVGIVASIVGLSKQFFEIGPEQHWQAHATLLLGTIALLITYFAARGLERQRIKWVVLGVICAWVADGANHLGMSLGSMYNPKWFIGAVEVLYLALPLAVAYAVIRHRVIDVRFVLSRSLAAGVIIGMIALMVFGIEWLFSARLPNSRLEGAAYVGIVLVVGFSLNAAWRWTRRTVDLVFFPRRYRAQEEAETVADALRRAATKSDLYDPLTAGIAHAFSLASVALFERVEDGGFLRVAAHGWPAGTIWHILPDDPLVTRVSQGRRFVDLDVTQWHEQNLPMGVAHPTAMLPVGAGKVVPALLLCGAHDDGAGLDPDELRTIRKLCVDAGLVYAAAPVSDALRAGSLAR